jgi:predicted dehydrogenase
MTKTVAVIGAGNLGSRHLQSLATSSVPLNVYAIDPFQESLQKAKGIFDQVPESEKHSLTIAMGIEELPSEIDFCVIATNSLVRRDTLEKLLEHARVGHILLEKFLFPKLEDYSAVGSLLKEKNVQASVNCARRMFPDYQDIKPKIKDDDPLLMVVSGGNLAVGTIAIHFIDLFAFLLDEVDILNIDTSGLEKKIYTSKRSGYIEFYGQLIIKSGRHTLIFQGYKNSNMPIEISITNGNFRHRILETNCIQQFSSMDSEWVWTESNFSIPYQSQLTSKVTDAIWRNKPVRLPKYANSEFYHRSLLTALLDFMKTELDIDTDVCNIT